ncbi:MAG: amino acid permease [Verrucomicrobiota bacterium]
MADEQHASLERSTGVAGAVLLGLGSILGTGVYVIVGLTTAEVGSWVLLAIAVGAFVATVNGLNSAQLAAAIPVSGGAYEYGYRLLNPTCGFVAGLMFMLAKCASAATAALAIGKALNPNDGTLPAIGLTIAMTAVVVMGLRRSNQVNASILTITIAGLLSLIFSSNVSPIEISSDPSTFSLMEACALIFVAFTGYGRIATMGEEIKEPRKNIPIAMIVTLLVSGLLYAGVSLAWLRGVQPGQLFTVAGFVALIGVVLNLILGLSRVLLAMARRKDVAPALAKLDKQQQPRRAILAVGAIIAVLCLLGDIKLAWSFSACTVLIYYGILNLAALRLSEDQRLYPRWLAYVGLASCFFLAFWVTPVAVVVSIACVAVGLFIRFFVRMMSH